MALGNHRWHLLNLRDPSAHPQFEKCDADGIAHPRPMQENAEAAPQSPTDSGERLEKGTTARKSQPGCDVCSQHYCHPVSHISPTADTTL